MPYEKNSKVLADDEIEGLKQDIVNLDTKISAFAVNLTVKDRKTQLKLGDRSLAFVEQALKYSASQKEFNPSFLVVEDFQKDWQLYWQLKDLIRLVEPVVEKLSDTFMAAGTDAYFAALSYFDAVKAAAKSKRPGSDSIVAELKKVYPRRKANVKPTEKENKTTSKEPGETNA